MRNSEHWEATKYVSARGRLRATKDTRELGAGSRLMADLIAEAYADAFKSHASGRLLDMGCGKVPFFAAYRAYVDDVQCIDWGRTHGTDYLDKECDLSGTIPYTDSAFDTILLSDVLEHLPEPAKCWQEMHRLLTPGGKLLLNVPFYYQIHDEPHDFYRYTEFALRRFAEGSGFNVIDLRPIGGALEILADVIGKLLAGARLTPLAGAVQSSARAFGRTAAGKRLKQATETRFPFGYFMVAARVGS